MKSFSLAVVLAVASALSPESLAAYKATHPERFTHEYTNEDITQHMLSHHAHTHDTVSVETHDHHETHKPEEVAAWKASHSEHEHHETHTPEEVAAWKASHPEHEHHEHPMNYTAAEVAAWKASHPEFEHRSHLDAVAKIAAYKAAHAEHFEHFGRSDCEEPPKMLQVVPSHHAYSAAELVVFAAGMTHAKQVEGYKASHTTEFTPQAVAAYKKSHPERVAVAVMMEAYTADELDTFRAGYEHYNSIVAPHIAEHPDAFSASKVAEYIFQHAERFSVIRSVAVTHEHHGHETHYDHESHAAHTPEEVAAWKASHHEA